MSEKCPHCGASMKKYWHKITPGLVKALAKTYQTIAQKGENVIDKDELSLTHGEYGNYQKLRFHGLIAKHIVDGKWKKGQWLITKRGGLFLKNEIAIPERVQTFRNRVVDHDPKEVTVSDVMRSEPYWEKEFEYELA